MPAAIIPIIAQDYLESLNSMESLLCLLGDLRKWRFCYRLSGTCSQHTHSQVWSSAGQAHSHLPTLCTPGSLPLTHIMYTRLIVTYPHYVHQAHGHLPILCTPGSWSLAHIMYTRLMVTYPYNVHQAHGHLPI